MARASFVWELAGDVLLIFDQNLGGPSVTNDIEQVLARIAACGVDLDKRRIIYRDSEGRWDRVATRGGQFAHFIPLDALSPQEALAQCPPQSPPP